MVDRSAAGKRPGYRPAVPVLEARPVPDARPGYGAQRPVATTVRFAVRLNKNLLRRLRAVGAAALLLAVIAPAAASAAPLPGAVPGAAPTPASTGSAATTGQAPTAGQSYGTSVTIRGHGFGHGEGMGQWGAYGYAIQGSTWQQILAHYYGNTAFGTGTHPPEGLNVRLQALDDRPHTSFVQDNGLMATLADNGAGRFRSLTMVETATAGLLRRLRPQRRRRLPRVRRAVQPRRLDPGRARRVVVDGARFAQPGHRPLPRRLRAGGDAELRRRRSRRALPARQQRHLLPGWPARRERLGGREPDREQHRCWRATCAAWCPGRCRRRGAPRPAASASTPCGPRPWPLDRSRWPAATATATPRSATPRAARCTAAWPSAPRWAPPSSRSRRRRRTRRWPRPQA